MPEGPALVLLHIAAEQPGLIEVIRHRAQGAKRRARKAGSPSRRRSQTGVARPRIAARSERVRVGLSSGHSGDVLRHAVRLFPPRLPSACLIFLRDRADMASMRAVSRSIALATRATSASASAFTFCSMPSRGTPRQRCFTAYRCVPRAHREVPVPRARGRGPAGSTELPPRSGSAAR